MTTNPILDLERLRELDTKARAEGSGHDAADAAIVAMIDAMPELLRRARGYERAVEALHGMVRDYRSIEDRVALAVAMNILYDLGETA